MYLCYKEKENLKFKQYTKKEDIELFNLAQKEFSFFYKLIIEFNDIIRLNKKLNLITQVSYEDANLEEIQDCISLYMTKVKNYLEKWKTKYVLKNAKLYEEIEKKYKQNKEFLLVYYLRNYEQHNGWIISYYKYTQNKDIEIYFNDIEDLIEKNRIASKDKSLLKELYPDKNIEVNLIELFNKFVIVMSELHKEFVRTYFFYNSKSIYYFTTLYNLLKTCLDKDEGEMYLLEKAPEGEQIDFRKMIKSRYLDNILKCLGIEVEIKTIGSKVFIDYLKKSIVLKREPSIGEIIKDQNDIDWSVYAYHNMLWEKGNKLYLVPQVLCSRCRKECYENIN